LKILLREAVGLMPPRHPKNIRPENIRPENIRVASYNIRKCIGLDRRRDPARIIAVLNELDADIIALQEADRRIGARASAIPLEILHRETPYRAVPLGGRADSIGWHGNAILVRRGVEIMDAAHVTLPTIEPRGAVRADVGIAGQRLRIIGMHLDLSGMRRHSQARAIIAAAEAGDAPPSIILGDCNAWRRGAASMQAFARHFDLVETGPSFHSRRPVAELDRIFHCRSLQAIAGGVHQTALSARASDHLPVWSEFAI
jgi:endonuclease/exonuclease/phosphatase family metal-dependent hydrolase